MDRRIQAWCWGSLAAACLVAYAQSRPEKESPVYITLPVVNEPELATEKQPPPPRPIVVTVRPDSPSKPTDIAQRSTAKAKSKAANLEDGAGGAGDLPNNTPASPLPAKGDAYHGPVSPIVQSVPKGKTPSMPRAIATAGGGRDATSEPFIQWHTLTSLPARQRTTKTLAIFTDAIGCRPCAQLAKSLEHPGVAQLAAGWQFVELTQAEANMLGARLYPTVFRWTGRAWMLIPFPVDLGGVLSFFGANR